MWENNRRLKEVVLSRIIEEIVETSAPKGESINLVVFFL